MYVIDQSFSAEYEVKRSKFLSFLVPFDAFEETEKELRTRHPKARHFVTASRHLNTYDQVEESFSDDGEPKGVAGMPTLRVLQGADIVNAAMITVRYFGGIKLGTGGMARAYADAANLAVEAAELKEYIKPFSETLTLPYAELGRLEYLVEKTEDVTLGKEHFGSGSVRVRISGREVSVLTVIGRLQGE